MHELLSSSSGAARQAFLKTTPHSADYSRVLPSCLTAGKLAHHISAISLLPWSKLSSLNLGFGHFNYHFLTFFLSPPPASLLDRILCVSRIPSILPQTPTYGTYYIVCLAFPLVSLVETLAANFSFFPSWNPRLSWHQYPILCLSVAILNWKLLGKLGEMLDD